MRYFIVKYLRRPDGRTDELTSISRNLRDKDVQTASVIMDFKTQTVLQAQLGGRVIDHDWDRIHDYYHQHYSESFQRLHAYHGRVPIHDTEST